MKRKIAAIMAADIAGYSKLVAEDEEETLRRLASYRSVFDDFIAKAAGRVFNTAGDAVLAEFPSAVDAVRCAIDIQESLRTRNMAYPPSRQMNFRIGLTVGDVVEREGDLLGDGVNIAARLQTLAEPGGICVARSVFEQVTNKLSVRFADIGEQHVKNIPTPIHAYTVAASGAHEQPQAQTKARSTMLAVALSVLAAAVVVGAGAVYWNLARAPSQAPGDAKSSPVVPPPATAQKPPTPAQSPPQRAAAPAASSAPAVAQEQPPAPPPQAAVAPPVILSPQPAPAPSARPRFDEGKLRALAKEQNIPLPQTIRMLEPSSPAAKMRAEYLGAWGGDRRWGRGGRHMILLVTYIDDAGTAHGIFCFGPPSAQSDNQSPANYFAFDGAFTADELKFQSGDGRFKYEFKLRPDGIMEGHAQTPSNKHPTISVERIN